MTRMTRTLAVVALAVALAGACGGGTGAGQPTTPEPGGGGTPATTSDDPNERFEPVPPEVDAARIAVELPAVPAFELPKVPAGTHSVKELRVAKRKFLDTDVKVVGTITWIYDCPKAVATQGETLASVQKRIDKDPTLCERPKFHLGDTATTPDEMTLWVVDVPRPPNKAEKARLPKAEIAAWPAVPKLAVGDRVVVSGRFAVSSPHNESNSDGLLVYAAIEPAPAGGAP
jgi:hypothetical protein